MELRDRNQLRGTVKALNKGDTLTEVILDIGGQEVVSVISSQAVDMLGIKPGEVVAAVVRSTEVTIAQCPPAVR